MNNKFKKNIQFGFIVTILLMVLNFLLKRILFENLTENKIGIMQLIIQILSYLNVVELGIGTSASFFFFQAYSKNLDEVTKVFSQITFIYKKIFMLANILGFILIYFFRFSLKNDLNFELILVWIFYQFSVTINFFNMPKILLFNSNQYNYIIIILEGCFKLLTLAFQIVVIIFYKNLFMFFLVELISSIFKYMTLNLLYLKYYKNIKYRKMHINFDILKKTGAVFFHKMANICVNNIDYILISRYISISNIALYSNYILVLGAVKTILYIFINAFISNLGHLFFKISLEEKNNKLREYNFYFSALATLLGIGFYFNINNFIIFWLGIKYVLSDQVRFFFTLSIYYFTIRQPIEIYKGVSGYYSDIISPVLETILNVVISIILIKKIGLSGVISGTFISSFISNFIVKAFLTLKYLKLNIFLYYMNMLQNIIISFLVFYFVQKNIKYLKLDTYDFKYFIVLNISLILGIGIIYIFIFKLKNRRSK